MKQITVRAVYLHAVSSGLLSPACCLAKGGHSLFDISRGSCLGFVQAIASETEILAELERHSNPPGEMDLLS